MAPQVWLFPGQGAQSVGMGKALADHSPAARAVFARADAALGWSVSKLCFEGPEGELMLTAHTQPAILVVSVALVIALREAYPGIRPAYAAGHSLGEYSALVAAEALSLEDAVRLVYARGQAMQSAVPEGQGGMVAIMGGDRETVQMLCDEAAQGEVLEPANFNAPGQIVVAGHRGGLARVIELAKNRKLRAMPLKVSAPFHCRLMQPARTVVEQELANLTIRSPDFPVVSNVEARPNSQGARVAALLASQVDGPVLWQDSISHLLELGVTRALEIGPGQVLAGLVRRIDKGLPVLSVGDPEGIEQVAAFLA